MLTAEQNELVTRTGPGTPDGALLRGYWQLAALTEELDPARPAKAVRLMGEELVLFRDDQGRYGLIGKHCPHRGADLCFGRLEDGGLRCAFHGWLFDVNGKCLEQPAEPRGSNFHKKIKHLSYPCQERNGIIFAYMGPGAPPPMPAFDCFAAPDSHTFAFKGLTECNWLQALEVGIDPTHASFLHRFFEDPDPTQEYGQNFKAPMSDASLPLTLLMRENPCPDIEIEETEFGLRIYALRTMDDARMHIRITNQWFPDAIVIPLSNDMNFTQWHVPIDDTNCWWYAIFSAFQEPVDKETMRAQRLELYTLPDYRPRRNKRNDYGYDADEQRTLTFTGMGEDINVHDTWAVESPGPIHDRTKEHLGVADKAIIAYRRMLLDAIDAVAKGGEPPFLAKDGMEGSLRGPAAIDTIGPANDWQAWWKQDDLKRRDASPWAGVSE